ncbi:hypothetical protein Mal33_02240 [Rosistilla oblonga]|uniref:Uncharacterized protein n=1 Tax=Rosistilla oblonga TaxID=2527990 RepID=A0A518IMG7_9BACT|nr:hypothetical protein Mal33_02240 [Rosistilla oblonga]
MVSLQGMIKYVYCSAAVPNVRGQLSSIIAQGLNNDGCVFAPILTFGRLCDHQFTGPGSRAEPVFNKS